MCPLLGEREVPPWGFRLYFSLGGRKDSPKGVGDFELDPLGGY